MNPGSSGFVVVLLWVECEGSSVGLVPSPLLPAFWGLFAVVQCGQQPSENLPVCGADVAGHLAGMTFS